MGRGAKAEPGTRSRRQLRTRAVRTEGPALFAAAGLMTQQGRSMTTISPFPLGTILGYPRIGPRRELKKAVEAFWAHAIDSDELERTAAELRAATRDRLGAPGRAAARLY